MTSRCGILSENKYKGIWMGYKFRPCDRNQAYLMPPSLRDWVPESDLSWFILDAVDQMDLSGFYKDYW